MDAEQLLAKIQVAYAIRAVETTSLEIVSARIRVSVGGESGLLRIYDCDYYSDEFMKFGICLDDDRGQTWSTRFPRLDLSVARWLQSLGLEDVFL